MPDEPAGVVAGKSARVMRALAECGCALNNGYMRLSLLALAVIPESLSPVWGMPHVPTAPDDA